MLVNHLFSFILLWSFCFSRHLRGSSYPENPNAAKTKKSDTFFSKSSTQLPVACPFSFPAEGWTSSSADQPSITLSVFLLFLSETGRSVGSFAACFEHFVLAYYSCIGFDLRVGKDKRGQFSLLSFWPFAICTSHVCALFVFFFLVLRSRSPTICSTLCQHYSGQFEHHLIQVDIFADKYLSSEKPRLEGRKKVLQTMFTSITSAVLAHDSACFYSCFFFLCFFSEQEATSIHKSIF